MTHIPPKDVRYNISRSAILGHESATQFSDLGLVQSRHGYDPDLLETIRQKALALKAEESVRKHLDLTFITGAQRCIPEIDELANDPRRIDRLSELAGTKIEPYPFKVVSSTVTFMGPNDGAVDWHCDGVPGTELIPLSISDPIIGGELEIYMGGCEDGKARTDRGETLDPIDLLRVKHKIGYSTLGQFHGVLHRTHPIAYGERITLVLNLRSVEMPHIDGNTLTYLAADSDHDQSDWTSEIVADQIGNQLASYRRAQPHAA